MVLKKSLLILGALALSSMLLSGCMSRGADESLGGDIYRKTPKETHQHHFPEGHHRDSAFGQDRDCVWDMNAAAYWCQFPKAQLPDK